jgi:hypothetical protein
MSEAVVRAEANDGSDGRGRVCVRAIHSLFGSSSSSPENSGVMRRECG